jgi:drug/metabolite transporter (DMT)-like permease
MARRAPVRSLAWMPFLLGFLVGLGFSFTFPATRVAVEGLDATFVGVGRAVIAGGLAAALLALRREPWPTREQMRKLAVVVGGVVVGFPLLSALALVHVPSSHAAVTAGIIPAATVVAAVMRAGERPTTGFWLASGAGLLSVLAFAAASGQGLPRTGDLLMLAAVVLVAFGYTEGAVLSRELGGWRVISWALVLSLPVTIPVTAVAAAGGPVDGDTTQWLCFLYVAVVSMFLSFFAWYAGLARGGVAKVGQVQLAQPVLTLIWSALLLGEHLGALTIVAAIAVLASVAATQRARVERERLPPLLASQG